MTTITLPRATVEQALEAMRCAVPTGKITLYAWDKAMDDLNAALAQQAKPVLQTCNCRWDGEVQVQQCTLHEAHIDAIHEWAERAKVAERKLAQQAEPVCKCDLRTRLVGDGCEVCNPELAAELAQQGEPGEPVATVTECEACFTPDVCQLRGTCDYYTASQMRIAAPPQQAEPVEPVAWMQPRTLDGYLRPDLGYETCSKSDYGAFPVYTAPPQRKPLTEEEIKRLWYDNGAGIELSRFSSIARAVERALEEEKNRGR